MDDHQRVGHIYFKELTGGHSCQSCNKFVHLLCGKPIGEEGYGKKVMSSECSKGENTGKDRLIIYRVYQKSNQDDNHRTSEFLLKKLNVLCLVFGLKQKLDMK